MKDMFHWKRNLINNMRTKCTKEPIMHMTNGNKFKTTHAVLFSLELLFQGEIKKNLTSKDSTKIGVNHLCCWKK